MTNWLAESFGRHRILVALLIVAITGIAVWGNHFSGEGIGFRKRKSSDAAQFKNQIEVQFGAGGSGILLVLDSDTLFTPATMTAVRRVVDEVTKLETVAGVIGLDRIPDLSSFPAVEKLIPPNDAPEEEFTAARSRALEHPLVVGQLLSPDGKTLLIPVVPNAEALGIGESLGDLVDRITTTAEAAAEGSDLTVTRTGLLPLRHEQSEAFDKEHVRFQIIAYSMVLILAIIMFRGVSAVIIVAGAPSLGLYWTLGILGFLSQGHNPLVQIILPVLVVMIGFTNGVHIMVDIRRSRAHGAEPVAASQDAIRHLTVACALTSLTTAIGFGSLTVSSSELIRDFGLDCMIGVGMVFVSVLTVIPLLSSTWLGRRVHTGHEHDIINKNLTFFEGLINFIIRHCKPITAVSIVATIIMVATGLTLRADSTLRSDFPRNSKAYAALEHVDETFGGVELIQVAVDWPENIKLGSGELKQTLREVVAAIDDEPLISHPLSILNIADSLPDQASSLNSVSFFAGSVPEARQFVRGVLRADLNRAIIIARIRDYGSSRYVSVFENLEARLAAIEAEHEGFVLRLTGDPVVRGRGIHDIIYDLAGSLSVAAVIILFVMGIAYRSLRIGLMCVVPNLFPLAVTASLLVLLGRPLEITSVCAFTICLGIAVDDTIHFLSRFRYELAIDGDVDAAIRRSFIRVGTALILSSVVLVSGFATVLTSQMPGHQVFAGMACATIAAALVGDLLILPAILATFTPRSTPHPSGPLADDEESQAVEHAPEQEATSLGER